MWQTTSDINIVIRFQHQCFNNIVHAGRTDSIRQNMLEQASTVLLTNLVGRVQHSIAAACSDMPEQVADNVKQVARFLRVLYEVNISINNS